MNDSFVSLLSDEIAASEAMERIGAKMYDSKMESPLHTKDTAKAILTILERSDGNQLGVDHQSSIAFKYPWIISFLTRSAISTCCSTRLLVRQIVEIIVTKYMDCTKYMMMLRLALWSESASDYHSNQDKPEFILAYEKKDFDEFLELVLGFTSDDYAQTLLCLKCIPHLCEVHSTQTLGYIQKLGQWRAFKRLNSIIGSAPDGCSAVSPQLIRDFFNSIAVLGLEKSLLTLLQNWNKIADDEFPESLILEWVSISDAEMADHFLTAAIDALSNSLATLVDKEIMKCIDSCEPLDGCHKAAYRLIKLLTRACGREKSYHTTLDSALLLNLACFCYLRSESSVLLPEAEWIQQQAALLCQDFLSRLELATPAKADEKTLLQTILVEQRPRLTSKDGRVNEVVSHGICWLFLQVKHPGFAPIVDHIADWTAGILSSTTTHVKTKAVHVLRHVFRETNPTELRWHKETFVEVVKRELYFRDNDYLSHILPFAIEAIQILEAQPDAAFRLDVFEQIVRDLDLYVTKLSQMKVYGQHLPALLQVLGIQMSSRLKILLELSERFVETEDPLLVSMGLCVVQQIIKHCWLRVPHHCSKITKVVIKALSIRIQSKSSPSPVINTDDESHALMLLGLIKFLCTDEWDMAFQEAAMRSPSLIPYLNRVVDDMSILTLQLDQLKQPFLYAR